MTGSHYADFFKLKGRNDAAVVAFPCNQFGAQESGSPASIKVFAQGKGLEVNRGNFWLMNKVDVNGPNTDPVYTFLKKHGGGADIRWNFATKFLVECSEDSGTCDIKRFDTQSVPSQLVSAKSGEL